jgi:hypothetical protein
MNAQSKIAGQNLSGYPSATEVKRLIKAARDAGLDPAGFEASPDGTIKVVEARAQAPDDLFAKLEKQGKI